MIDTVLNAGDDLYKALGLDKDSLDLLTEDEKDEKIKSCYREISRFVHTDKVSSGDDALKNRATEAMQKLNAAKDNLGTQGNRDKYDKPPKPPTPPSPKPKGSLTDEQKVQKLNALGGNKMSADVQAALLKAFKTGDVQAAFLKAFKTGEFKKK